MRGSALALCIGLFTTPALRAQSTDAQAPAALQWAPAPAALPKGAMMAVVSGDPSKAEQFEVQLSMPSGYRIPPHFHPTDETVEVVKGTFLVGMGDKFDVKKTATMKKGDHGMIPAEHHHFGMAKGATVVDIKSMGPFAITYVNAADDPQQQAAKAKPGT